MTMLDTGHETMIPERAAVDAGPRPEPARPEADADPGIADLLESLGASGESYAVTVYAGTNQRGKFLTTYDGPDFSLPRVQADYGAGNYFAQIKRGTRTVRGVQFAIGPAPKSDAARAIAPVPAPVPVPAPAVAAEVSPVALLMAQLARQHEMMLAILKSSPAAAPVDPLANIDRVLKLVQPRTQLSEVLEAVRAIREFAPDAGAAGGEWAGLIQSLPAVLQAIAQGGGAAGGAGAAGVDTHPEVIRARRIIAAAEARRRAPVIAAAPSPAAAPATLEAPSVPAPSPEPAPADARIAFVREAIPSLRMLAALPSIDPDTYAQVAIDVVESRGGNVGDVLGSVPGELVRLVLIEAPDLAPHVGMLDALEKSIRGAEQPGLDDDDDDPMRGAIDDDGNPRAGDPSQYPSKPAA